MSKVQNEVLIGRKALPEKEKIERDLEAAVENASDPSRLRILPGDSPSRNELTNRIEKLEVCKGLG